MLPSITGIGVECPTIRIVSFVQAVNRAPLKALQI